MCCDAFVRRGPKMKSVVAIKSKIGMSCAKDALDVRSKRSAPRILPATLAIIIFVSAGRGISISLRNEPVDAKPPSHIATLFVAFAEIGATPVASTAGNEMKLPPPAAELMALARKAAPPRKRPEAGFR
jgi:hypothetical protein